MTQTKLPPIPRLMLPRAEQRALTLELEAELEDRLATRIRQFRCGTAMFNDDFPRAGALNVLRVDSDVPALDSKALLDFTDELQAGLPQRSLRIVDDERAAELRPTFAAAGWVTGEMTLMAPRRRPDRPVDTSQVHEVTMADLHEARMATLRREHRDLDSAEQLAVANVVPADGFELHSYAVMLGGEVAAYSVARVRGEVAKLTEVDAFSRSEGHGIGRAIIWGTVAALRQTGVKLVAVEVESETWPAWTYKRLGFEPVGHTHRFVRPWG